MRIVFTYFLILFCILSCKEKDPLYNQTLNDLKSKIELLKNTNNGSGAYNLAITLQNELLGNKNSYKLTKEEVGSLQFLYAYMPINDMAENSFEYFVNVTKQAYKTKQMEWSKNVTPELFKYFILPPRVNNETLDNAREIFFDELYPRVKDLSMYDAVIEINHWLREKIVYQPTDGRTTPPLQTVARAYGRCGEESTVAVTALRAMGIPSRQVYVPRWAHTNSNHAWVEVWVDNTWYYLGACEPEPMLDRGWFTASASRAMLVNTYAYGKLEPSDYTQIKGEIISKNKCFTEVSNISTYAPVKKAVVKVVDSMNNPLPNVDVSFEIINGNNIASLAERKTDKNGIASLTTGLGTFIIEAFYSDIKDYYAIRELNVSNIDTLLISLDKDERLVAKNNIVVNDYRITPPAETRFPTALTEQMQQIHDMKCAIDDSIRLAYTQTFRFADLSQAQAFSDKIIDKGLSPNLKENLTNILSKSLVGGVNIESFLLSIDPKNLDLAVELLSILRVKDLQEISLSTYLDYLNGILKLSNKIILNPRFSNELPVAYKLRFWDELVNNGMENSDSLSQVYNAINNILSKITLLPESEINPRNFFMTPISILDFGMADNANYLVFARALFNTVGIDSRVNSITSGLEILVNNKWVDFPVKTVKQIEAPVKSSELIINDPIGKKMGRKYLLQKWSGSSYKNVDEFSYGSDGLYRIITGIRAADGTVLTRIMFFEVEPNSKRIVNVEWYPLEENDLVVIGNMNAEWKYTDSSNNLTSIINCVGRNFFVLGFLEPTKEPSQHFIRELSVVGENLELPVILLFNDSDKMNFFFKQNYNLKSNINYGFDSEDIILKGLQSSLMTQDLQARLPVIIVADSFGNIYYQSIGYNIGIPETITKLNLPIK